MSRFYVLCLLPTVPTLATMHLSTKRRGANGIGSLLSLHSSGPSEKVHPVRDLVA